MVNPKEKARSYDCTNEVEKTLKTEAEKRRRRRRRRRRRT